MFGKAMRCLYNSVRFIGLPNYRRLLAIDSTAQIDMNRCAELSIGARFRARRNVEIHIRSGQLHIGDDVFLNSGCIITAREKISVGSGTIFGPNVLVYDHDHAVLNGCVVDNQFVTAPITIGKNVWIGAGTIVLKGAVIEDNCVIAAGSVVTGTVPAGSVMVQKRERTILALP